MRLDGEGLRIGCGAVGDSGVLLHRSPATSCYNLGVEGLYGRRQTRSTMATAIASASPLFLREPEIRRGMELMYFAQSTLARSTEERLSALGLGRAHHRALYFIARHPDLTVSALLGLLGITKQSLGRVLNELVERNLVETRVGERDRRQRLLRLSQAGKDLEGDLFECVRQVWAQAYASAGQNAVSGFWAVLEGITPDEVLKLLSV
ncbi:MarR family transcriptional regulator [Sphingomonas sp. TF3]|nr:MarR family transcriptional regulator [Sphingomonas sp. TF3]